MDLTHYAPSKVGDEDFARRLATYFRRSASPGAAVALLKMNTLIDITNLLPVIHVPTLVLHRSGDCDAKIEEGQWIADRIPGAQFKELPGDDHFPWVGDQDAIIGEIQNFLTGRRLVSEPTRVLATIMFTDIVSSTDLAQEMRDQAWKSLLDRHDIMSKEIISQFGGKMVKSTGDGILATFDGPGRGIACANKIMEKGRALGLNIRSGLHTGECELRGDEVAGVAVHLAARIAALAEAGELLVSRTVRDLVAGSRFDFTNRGEHELKGFSEKWILYSVN